MELLHHVSDLEHTAVLHLLLENKPRPDLEDSFGRTPLSYAAQNGHLDVVQALVRSGADVYFFEGEIWGTALGAAAMHGHTSIVRFLHDEGASIDVPPNLITKVASRGHMPVLELHITYGAPVNYNRHDSTETPLMAACQWGHTEIVRLLLKHSADVNL
ncbi:hypothetical protein PMG11_05811 [Penicillium brasilianum]|uniref:Uncharacterized protein n=1 Tax=Penicillium brasilianum TaxID=104259 RepID=A0A0F7TKJ1_PENBI|nr:hypothetical protein PMG11_05811 [Penicillium brasilianum]